MVNVRIDQICIISEIAFPTKNRTFFFFSEVKTGFFKFDFCYLFNMLLTFSLLFRIFIDFTGEIYIFCALFLLICLIYSLNICSLRSLSVFLLHFYQI